MGGDYTRFTFDPRLDYAGVLSQQGRVQLDADWNELFDILDRRFRAETVDLIGRSGVPANAPNGFALTWQGTSDLRIGRGRMYVDGLIAENHGSGTPTEYEPIWDEPQGHDHYVRWSEQPYEPQWRLKPQFPSGNGPHLVYLDVWRRERTAAEFSDLVDPALGVDTDTRLQTVWQVRFIANAGAGVKCSTDWNTIADYRDKTRLSGARLTTQGLGVTQPDDPCFVSPTGGYRGRENRLYRVEIHDDGSISGQRSFKWSRDNGSVATKVLSINDAGGTKPRLQVSRIGRDAILRFRVNDWVEVRDDALEFDGVPGVLAQVDGTEDATNTVWLKNMQPAGPGSSPAALTDISTARNASLRRWDGTDAHGVVVIGGTSVELEDGVFVSFDFTAGAPRVGDWWSFAARSITGKVEVLDKAPPRGIRHHYAPLGILRGPGVKPDDCRTFFPVAPTACCDCDVCVDPESHKDGTLTIQSAIDKVKKTGGKVCLQAGVYRLRKPLVIQGAQSVQLVGKGHKTMLRYDAPGAAIEIDASREVTIERLALSTSMSGLGKLVGSEGKTRGKRLGLPEVGIAITSSVAITVERCLITQSAPVVMPARKITSAATTSPVHGGVGIGLAGMLAGISIRHNVIMAEVGVGSLATGTPIQPTPERRTESGRVIGGSQVWDTGNPADERLLRALSKSEWGRKLPPYLLTFGLVIEQNTLACWRVGVDLLRLAGAVLTTAFVVHLGETRVGQNSFFGCSEVGILIGGMSAVGNASSTSKASYWYASPAANVSASVAAVAVLSRLAGPAPVEVLSNALAVGGIGIAVGSNAARIAGNDIAVQARTDRSGPLSPSPRVHGIMIFRNLRVRLMGELQIDGNRVHDPPGYGIAIETTVISALIKRNQIVRAGAGGIATALQGAAYTVAIEDNQITDTTPDQDDRVSSPTGIQVSRAGQATIARNEVTSVGMNAFSPPLRTGIRAVACQSLRIAENDVRDIGPDSDFAGASVGIQVEPPYENVEVSENTVRHPDYGEGGLGSGDSLGLLIGTGPEEIQVTPVVAEGEPAEGARLVAEAGRHWMRTAMQSTSTAAEAAAVSPVIVRAADDTFEVVGPDSVLAVAVDSADVSVRGNLLEGAGNGAALVVHTQGSCLASENRCDMPDTDSGAAVAWIAADGAAIVGSNHAEGRGAWYSIFIRAASNGGPASTVLGNVTTGDIILNWQVLGNPWAPLNVRW